MLLLVWQAAAPGCHVHADVNCWPHELSSVERLRLALHLHTRHSSSEQSCPHDDDWHTHFGMPEDAISVADVVSLQPGCGWPVPLMMPPDGLVSGMMGLRAGLAFAAGPAVSTSSLRLRWHSLFGSAWPACSGCCCLQGPVCRDRLLICGD
jgi:hypothetical protein